MPIQFYDGVEFVLQRTNGEAEKLFGPLPLIAGKPPTLKINIDRVSSMVSFTYTQNDASPDHGRNFPNEAMLSARYIDGDKFENQNWPDPMNDMIIGHINWNDPGKRQLFLMWSRVDPNAPDPRQPLRLGFFFFTNGVRFSSCNGGVTVPGIGQDNGGGSGTGPTHP
ncbi:MAG TPA: hypothetical protein VLB69_00440 [Rudaea sp.]|nr:hypothetical protein [Rudaea sp.]